MIFLLSILLQTSPSLADDVDTISSEQKSEEKLHVSSYLTIKVQKKEVTADLIVQKAKEVGGYYSSRTEEDVHLKIPVAQALDFVDFVVQQGLVVERELNSNSLHQEIIDIESRLKTREDLLNRYFDILNKAQGENVLTVEHAVIDLVSEIEDLKGRLRKKEHAATFADIHVGFQYRERRAPVKDGSSSFYWLNSLNIQDIQEAFQYSLDTTRKRATGMIPENFAMYEDARDIRAASHDGVLYRIRVVRPDQDAELDFWSEAVRYRMYAAGYHPYSAQKDEKNEGEEKEISSEQLDSGVVIKCLAASGEDDLAYWLAFSKKDKYLILIEATGEISRFQNYEEEITKAIQETL